MAWNRVREPVTILEVDEPQAMDVAALLIFVGYAAVVQRGHRGAARVLVPLCEAEEALALLRERGLAP